MPAEMINEKAGGACPGPESTIYFLRRHILRSVKRFPADAYKTERKPEDNTTPFFTKLIVTWPPASFTLTVAL